MTIQQVRLLAVRRFARSPASDAGRPATTNCPHSQPRNLQLDLAGVKAVVFDIGPHDLQVNASPNARGGHRRQGLRLR